MRIANLTIYDSIRTRLNSITDDMNEANTAISTMKKINKLSDDPVGLVSVLDLRSSLDSINQLERNVSIGESWLTMTESAFTQTQDLIANAKEIAIQMANATQSGGERDNAAATIDGILRQVLTLSNTQVDDRYIFSGTKTDTIPFTFDDEDNPTVVNYSGNNDPFSVKIGDTITIDIGRDGEDVYGAAWDDSNIFKTLMDLKTDLENNYIDGITSAISELDTHYQSIGNQISDVGVKMNNIEIKRNIIADFELTYSDRMSKIEDVDITEALIELETVELAYQAALSSASKVMAMSLLDYM